MKIAKKNCLLCAEPFIPRRSDAVFCSGSCRAKYSRLKKTGELSGISQNANEHATQSVDQPESKKPEVFAIAKTVDAIDLEPFMNTLGDDDWSTPQLKEVKDQPVSNETKQNKTEVQSETDQPKENLSEKFITTIVKQENPAYKKVSDELAQCRKDIRLFEGELIRLTRLIEQEKGNNGSGYVYAGAGIGLGGSLIYDHFQSKPTDNAILPDQILAKDGKPLKYYRRAKIKQAKKQEPEKKGLSFWEILLYGALGTGAGAIAKAATEESREKEKAKKITRYNREIAECREFLALLHDKETVLRSELSRHPSMIEAEKRILNPAYNFGRGLLDNLHSKQVNQKTDYKEERLSEPTKIETDADTKYTLNGANEEKKEKNMKTKKNLETDKIKSMDNISKEKKPLLNFQGKWAEFLGQPQTNFYCAIHGMSGEGKSHLAMQFGKYLAQNFGNVLYVSGEEGFSVTFQKKIAAIGANVSRFYAAAFKTGEEILKEVPNQYHFIIIDSLNNMGVDPDMMNAIRARFNKSGIIAICQSTKDGKIRGSYQTVHDCDIAIKVVNKIATTTKNRFYQVHQDFDVFGVYKQKSKPQIQVHHKRDELDEDFDNTIK